MKNVLAVLLIIHGLIVASQSSSSFKPIGGVANPSWIAWWPANLGQSWLLVKLNIEQTLLAKSGGVVWLVAGLVLIAAGLGIWGLIIPTVWWRVLALTGAILSLFMFVIYLHPFYAIGFGASIVLLLALLLPSWPILEKFGL